MRWLITERGWPGLIVILVGITGGLLVHTLREPPRSVAHAQTPPPAPAPDTITQVYGLTFERDDFTVPPAVGGTAFSGGILTTTYKTQVPPRTNFMLVWRNGLLLREGADYTKAPGGVVSFVINGVPTVKEADLITILYFR